MIRVEDLDYSNMESMLSKHEEITEVIRQLNKIKEKIELKVREFMTEHKLQRYIEPKTKSSVSIISTNERKVDMQQLRIMITDAKFNQVMKNEKRESLIITSKKQKVRLNR